MNKDIAQHFLAMTTTVHSASSAERKAKKGMRALGRTAMDTRFASRELTAGQMNAIVKKLGGYERAMELLQGKLIVSQAPSWREQEGAIHFSVTSDGTTGEGWIKRLEEKDLLIGDCAKRLLLSDDFKPTSGVRSEVAVLRATLFFDEDDRTTENICAEANRRGLSVPNAEVACLIHERFTGKDIQAMGLWWIVVMHDLICDSDGNPNSFYKLRAHNGVWLNACRNQSRRKWDPVTGFAFVSA